MKLKTIATALMITAATSVGAVAAQAEEVTYRGDVRSTSICRAIVEDNPKALQTELRKAARDNRNTRITPAVARDFQCNGQSLDDFAVNMGSRKVSAHFSGSSDKAVAQN